MLNLVFTLVGVMLVGVLVLYGFLYASGSINMPPHKEKAYRSWVKKKGPRFKKSLLLLLLLYLMAIAFQLYSYFS